jgi:hypothetical protein
LPVVTFAEPQQQVNVNDRAKCVDKSHEVFQEMERMASQSDSLAQTMQMKMNRILHELNIQETTQQISGKEVLTNADMFVRPDGLKLKRGLCRVDLYHGGGKQTKQLLKTYLKKRREQNIQDGKMVKNHSSAYTRSSFAMPYTVFLE